MKCNFGCFYRIVDVTSMPFHWERMRVFVTGGSLNPLAPEQECISINVDQPSLLWWGKTLIIIKNIIYPRNNNLKLAGLYSNIISLRLGRDGGSWPRGHFGMYVVPWIQPQSSCPGTRTSVRTAKKSSNMLHKIPYAGIISIALIDLYCIFLLHW